MVALCMHFFFFSSRRRHTRFDCDWSSDVCSSDLTPLQALNLMNDDTFVEAARKLAERMMTEGGTGPRERIEYAYGLVLARPPMPAEMQVVLDTLADFEARYRRDRKSAREFLAHGDS